MIGLESERWSTLRDAFGAASPVAEVLRAIGARVESDEMWTDLWSRIYHQGDVCEASYAAVPHLIKIAGERLDARWDAVALPAAIEAARLMGRAPAVPSDLDEAYQGAIRGLEEVCILRTRQSWDHVNGQAILAGLAASKRLGALADAILELGPQAAGEFLESVGKGGRHGVGHAHEAQRSTDRKP